MWIVKNDHRDSSGLTETGLQRHAGCCVFNITKMKHYIAKIAVVILSGLAVVEGLRAGPTAADVGDAETFGHSALYMGATSGFETLQLDPCPAATPTPSPVPNGDSFCDQLNPAPALTTFSHDNICRINLPKKATRNVIYPVLNIFLNYQLQNSTGADQTHAELFFTAGITIVSAALNDPSCVDPNTSAPCGGQATFLFNYSYRDDRTMHDGDRQRLRETLVRAGNTGLTRAQMQALLGLTPAAVDALFTGPMTVRLDIEGGARDVTDASITCNMRLFGD
jgi:hypothetical protein